MSTEPPLPAVVVSYGAADAPESWDLVARVLAPRFRVVIPRRSLDIDPVEQLIAVIDALPTAPIVIGHSYGGLLASAAAERSVHGTAGLVLVDATSSRAAERLAARIVLGADTVLLGALARIAGSAIGRRLVDHDLVPLCPEQRALRRAFDADRYGAWREVLRRGIADGTAARELAAVIPAAERAHDLPEPRSGIAVVHSVGLTRMLERPRRSFVERVTDIVSTGDRFHNIHMVHPDAIADAVERLAAQLVPPRAAA